MGDFAYWPSAKPLFKKDKFSIPEAHVDKKFKKFFLHDVSN